MQQLDMCILEFFYTQGQQNIFNTTTWDAVDWCIEGGHDQIVC